MWIVAALAVLPACSVKTMAVKTVANTLSETGDVFTRDDDPELVADALPFALKLYESLLESVPTHVPLLVSTCSGFTQYGYAFVEGEADALDQTKQRTEVLHLQDRALKLYLRARGYCLRGMDARFGAGTRDALLRDPAAAVAKAKREDVPLLYWTAASWGAAIQRGNDTPDLVVDLPTVRALAERALALDGAWNRGSVHELLITLDGLPEAVGESGARAGALCEGRRDSKRPLARSVRGAGHCRCRARPGPRRVRAAAEGGARDRSREGSVDAARESHYPEARPAYAGSDRRTVREIGILARRLYVHAQDRAAHRAGAGSRVGRAGSDHHHQARHPGAARLLVAQGAPRHGRRVGRQDRGPRQAHGLSRRHSGQ
jgi:hypothetical protein